MPYIFRRSSLATLAFAFFLINMSNVFAQSNKTDITNANNNVIVKKHHKKKHTVILKTVSKKKSHVTPKFVKNYPPPGSSGEERNFDWLRKRAFPNEYIDPSYYPNALEEARRLPTYKPYGKENIQSAMQWQSIGPFTIGGRVTAIATHPTDSNTFYVGAAAGGLWKTIDHGTTWTALTDTFASLPIGCITLDPHDANTIYIGMGECNNSGDSYPGNGLWRSVDGGLKWNFLGLGKTQYIAKVIIDPTDKNVIYVCAPGIPTLSNAADSNRGVWKSLDFGASWRRSLLVRAGKSRTSTPVPVIDLVMNPQDSKDLVAAMWQQPGFVAPPGLPATPYTGLWRSRDSGASWYRIDTLPSIGFPNGFALKRLSRISLFWTTNGLGIPTLFGVVSKIDKNPLTKQGLDDENLFGIYKTTDPEHGWKTILDSSYRIPFGGVIFQTLIDSIDLFNRQGGYDNFIVGRPGSDATGKDIELYVGGIDMIRSTNAGLTWTNITKAYPHYFANDRSQHSDQHALAFTAAKNGSDLLNGQDGGVFNSKDYGATWSRINGLPITMIYHLEPWAAGMANLPNGFPADSLKVFGGTQDNGSIGRGFTANPDWDWINRGDGGQAQADPGNKDHLITSQQLAGIFFRNSSDSLHPFLQSDLLNHDPTAKKWTNLTALAFKQKVTDSSEPAAFIAPVVLDKQNGTDLYFGKNHVYHAKLDFTNPENTIIQKWSPLHWGNLSDSTAWYAGNIDAIALGVRDSKGRPMLWAAGYSSAGPSIWRTTFNELLPIDMVPQWVNATGSGLSNNFPNTLALDKNDSMTVFLGMIGSSANHVFKTTTGGKKWINISSNLPNIAINTIIIDSLAETSDPRTKNQCLIVATDVGVFVTTDGGTTWSNLGTGMPHLVVGTISMYKNWLIAGTHGRSAWALDISSLQAQPLNAVREKNSASNQFGIRSIYPSPLHLSNTSMLHITMNGATDKNVSLEIMNAATGASIYKTNIAMNGEALDLKMPANISSGSYLVEITTEQGENAIGQLVIVK